MTPQLQPAFNVHIALQCFVFVLIFRPFLYGFANNSVRRVFATGVYHHTSQVVLLQWQVNVDIYIGIANGYYHFAGKITYVLAYQGVFAWRHFKTKNTFGIGYNAGSIAFDVNGGKGEWLT